MKFRFFVIFFLSMFLAFNNNIFAVESNNIPLELVINGNSNQSIVDRFKFVMTPKDENNPMPDGSVDGKYNITLDGVGIFNIPNIEFKEPGDYEYEVYQVKGDNPQFEYDTSLYTVIITVTNSDDLSSLETLITITKENSDEKYDKLVFENTYFPIKEDIPDTSDINIYLYSSILGLSIGYIVYNMKKINLKKS